MEYDYATSRDIPVCAFIHKNIGELKAKDVDSDPEKAAKLTAFRDKVSSGKIVKFWDKEDNLEADALLALTNAINRKPQIGWRRANLGSSRGRTTKGKQAQRRN